MARATFVWGLKRSGIHLVVAWLFANHGGSERDELVTDGLHPQLCDGYADSTAGVGFYNNCGRLHSRRLELGEVTAGDFDAATRRHRATIFSIEDCSLQFAPQAAGVEGATNLLVLRDPLNNLASRLQASSTRPAVFRVDSAYLDLVEAYCAEYLGLTHHLMPKTIVSYNRFVGDRSYRDQLAARLGVDNVDAVSDVPGYGGGSSFSGRLRSSEGELMGRFRQRPIPPGILEDLLGRDVVREACSTVFGYDLAALGAGA